MGGINTFEFELTFKYLSLLPLLHAAHPLTNVPALNPICHEVTMTIDRMARAHIYATLPLIMLITFRCPNFLFL